MGDCSHGEVRPISGPPGVALPGVPQELSICFSAWCSGWGRVAGLTPPLFPLRCLFPSLLKVRTQPCVGVDGDLGPVEDNKEAQEGCEGSGGGEGQAAWGAG